MTWLLAAGAFWIGISFGFVGGAWWASALTRSRQTNDYSEDEAAQKEKLGE